jgi:mycothiol system anti-sigma-R factor
VKPECEQALRDIERFLDGEMTAPQAVEVESHLHSCTPCMERADFKRHLRVLIAERCGCDEVPETLRLRVAAILEEPPRPSTAEA